MPFTEGFCCGLAHSKHDPTPMSLEERKAALVIVKAKQASCSSRRNSGTPM